MNPKFLILYIIAGTLALALVVYNVITGYSQHNYNTARIILNAIICIFFYYLSYKIYHEKKDKELM